MQPEFERLVTDIDRTKSVRSVVLETGFELGGAGKEFVHTVPCGEGDRVRLVFFQPDWDNMPRGGISSEEIEEEFARRSLRPDPRAHIRLIGLEPELALQCPSVSIWCYEDRWYSLIFRYRSDEPDSPKYALLVCRPRKWTNNRIWFCGVREIVS
jgi:hypothetical protein